jgi:hypothetical protein
MFSLVSLFDFLFLTATSTICYSVLSCLPPCPPVPVTKDKMRAETKHLSKSKRTDEQNSGYIVRGKQHAAARAYVAKAMMYVKYVRQMKDHVAGANLNFQMDRLSLPSDSDSDTEGGSSKNGSPTRSSPTRSQTTYSPSRNQNTNSPSRNQNTNSPSSSQNTGTSQNPNSPSRNPWNIVKGKSKGKCLIIDSDDERERNFDMD